MAGPLRGGGMEAVLWLPTKQQVRPGSQSPPGALFHANTCWRIAALSFSLTEGVNFGQIWRSSQTHVLVTEWAWVWLLAFLFSLVGQPCCIVLR